MDTGTEVDKQTQIADWIGRLRISVQRAGELQVQLRERLSPLLRDAPPFEDKKGVDTQGLVPLANDICTQAWTLDSLSDHYQEMLSLLEL